MNGIAKKILSWVLFFVCVGLVYLIYNSIMQPVKFNKETDRRKAVAIQNLKDIRTLQTAYKSEKGVFTASVDTLKDFYENGQMSIIMQVGSRDDSLAVAHTDAVKKANRRLTNEDLYKMYLSGDRNLVFAIENKINVRDTLFKDRPDFNVDALKTIPFSEGDPILMDAIVKTVSGVQVPLFEAKMPYKSLLKGLDNQLRINLDAEQRDMNRYEGLQVGSISAPNNNAGNWE